HRGAEDLHDVEPRLRRAVNVLLARGAIGRDLDRRIELADRLDLLAQAFDGRLVRAEGELERRHARLDERAGEPLALGPGDGDARSLLDRPEDDVPQPDSLRIPVRQLESDHLRPPVVVADAPFPGLVRPGMAMVVD